MKLGPLLIHEPGVAIGRDRIGVLTEDALVVRDTARLDEVVRVPMHEPRALTVTADGSLLASDAVRTVWLLTHDQKPRKFPHLILLPHSTIFPDRGTPDQFWVVAAGGTTFYEYVLESSPLSILIAQAWISLDDYDGRLFGSLRDGSFLYATPTGFRRFFGSTNKEDVKGEAGDAFRLLPASRVDTLWLLTSRRAQLFRLLAGKLVELRSVPLSAMAFDVDADGPYLAVLELLEPDDAPWRMTLEVFDVEGRRHVREGFTTTESLAPRDWVKALKRNRRLSIRAVDEDPLVAVGGPDELHVFHADTGVPVQKASLAPPGTAKPQ
jgi:hypothetical protein